MITSRRITLVISFCIPLFFSACKPDNPQPQVRGKIAASGNAGPERPNPECSPSFTYPLSGNLMGSIVPAGSVEILNGLEDNYLLFSASPGWDIIKTYVWAGHDLGDLPTEADGKENKALFPFVDIQNPPQPYFSLKLPMKTMASANYYYPVAIFGVGNGQGGNTFTVIGTVSGSEFGPANLIYFESKMCDGVNTAPWDPNLTPAPAPANNPSGSKTKKSKSKKSKKNKSKKSGSKSSSGSQKSGSGKS